jgi:hypothetical protein
MIDSIVSRAKGILLDPVATFRQCRTDEPGTVFAYFIALLLVNAILSALIAPAAWPGGMQMYGGMGGGAATPFMVFFLALIGGFVVTLILAAWIHLWVYVVGGRRGIMQTTAAVIYGDTPGLLLGWIPLIGIIAGLWSLVLVVLGIRELQELTTGKAVLAVAIAVIIPLILIILAAALFMVSYSTITPVPVPAGFVR